MAARIRLTRMGRKKKPFYRIVVIDSRKKRDGEYIDKVGHYNPLVHPAEVVIDHEKAMHWMQQGAQPSDTVKSLFSNQGILHKFDMLKKGFAPEKIEEEMKKWQILQDERIKRAEALTQQKTREQKKAPVQETHAEKVTPVEKTEETKEAVAEE